MRNGVELSKDNYSLTIDSDKNQKVLKITENGLEAGKTVEYTIEVVVNLLRGNKTAVEIIYENSLNVAAFEIANSRIEHILQPEKVPSSDDNNDNNENTNSSSNLQPNIKPPTMDNSSSNTNNNNNNQEENDVPNINEENNNINNGIFIFIIYNLNTYPLIGSF